MMMMMMMMMTGSMTIVIAAQATPFQPESATAKTVNSHSLHLDLES